MSSQTYFTKNISTFSLLSLKKYGIILLLKDIYSLLSLIILKFYLKIDLKNMIFILLDLLYPFILLVVVLLFIFMLFFLLVY